MSSEHQEDVSKCVSTKQKQLLYPASQCFYHHSAGSSEHYVYFIEPVAQNGYDVTNIDTTHQQIVIKPTKR